ncbi:cation diffusion facilitator family transporter [Azospirillum sp. TSO22-1]|uniref:cation diffusion facilitator family transporter n=1 Tax=Azospirillum sp. TSO22-1 TaxID=716789 RepID=UPI000D61C196|nr:cation diffusion facilitator family transporter [Azospirillum sp. TSO22-1]PWC56654.1 cobalt transporter [Azospirillum sp. TSO22-1]
MPHDHAHGHRHPHEGHDRGHSHGIGGHHHGPVRHDRAFAIGTALNLGFVAVEAFYGVVANSVALLADAGHNLSDVLGLLLAWGAAWLTRRRPTQRHTYGFGSSSILASLLNAVVLLVAVGAIAWEAVGRLSHPEPVEGGVVMWVAAVGIAINTVTAWLFMGGKDADLNVKGAYLHMVADAGVSLGVVVAALLIGWTGWLWLDPLVSLAIVAVIVVGTWGLLRESANLAMNAIPEGVRRSEVEDYLAGLPGVVAVHDLHIWGLSTTDTALTAHLVRPGAGIDDELLRRVAHDLKERYGIGHATIQVEHDGDGCHLAPVEVV